jgi:hypothetical protein
VYTAVSLQANHRLNELKLRRDKLSEAFKLIDAYQVRESTKFIALIKACGKTKIRDLDPKLVSDTIATNIETRSEILHFMNFFEMMAVSIKKDFADEPTLRDFFCDIVNMSYHLLSTYIATRRSENQSTKMFVGYEDLAKRWSASETSPSNP